MKLAFVIPAYNEEALIGKCLESVVAEIARAGADAEGDAFQRLYFQALQHSPDLVVLTRQVAGALSR